MNGWVAPGTARERILVYGAMGTWKSSGALEIARKVAGDLFIVDTDEAYPALLEREYEDVAGKCHVEQAEDWESLCAGLDWAFSKADRDDWVVIDSCSDALDFGLDHYNSLIRGEDVSEYLANWAKRNDASKAKSAGTQGAIMEAGIWDFFGPAWRKRMVRRIKAPGCHLYITAQAQAAGLNPNEDRQTKEMFGGIGWKPRGQRDIGFNPATVLYLSKDKMGKGYYSVAKDWGRERTHGPLHDIEYTNLAVDFLFKKMGWRPSK